MHVSHVLRGWTLEKFEGAYDQCCSGDKCDGTNGTIGTQRQVPEVLVLCVSLLQRHFMSQMHTDDVGPIGTVRN